METRSRLELSKYRFERALKTLETSKQIIAMDTNASANRSYYAIFYALLAVTSLDGFEASKHSSVISYFNRNYVKTKIFSGKASDLIRTSFRIRTNADYGEFYTVSTASAQIQINSAETIISMIRPYLEERWAEMEAK